MQAWAVHCSAAGLTAANSERSIQAERQASEETVCGLYRVGKNSGFMSILVEATRRRGCVAFKPEGLSGLSEHHRHGMQRWTPPPRVRGCRSVIIHSGVSSCEAI